MRPVFFLVLAAVFTAALSLPAAAQGRQMPGVLPLDSILPGIIRTHPGRFYDADGPTPGADGLLHYHLKWMTPDGRIEWLDTDARTGRVLATSPGRDSFDGPGAERYFAPAPSYPIPDFGSRFRGGSDDYGWGGGYPGGNYPGDRGQGYGGERNRGNDRGDRDRRDR